MEQSDTNIDYPPLPHPPTHKAKYSQNAIRGDNNNTTETVSGCSVVRILTSQEAHGSLWRHTSSCLTCLRTGWQCWCHSPLPQSVSQPENSRIIYIAQEITQDNRILHWQLFSCIHALSALLLLMLHFCERLQPHSTGSQSLLSLVNKCLLKFGTALQINYLISKQTEAQAHTGRLSE